MKRNDDYSSPKCDILTVEAAGLLATSTVITPKMDIKDPIWNTDGDYGLE